MLRLQCIAVLFLLSLGVAQAQGDKFFINGKFKIDGGSNSGAKIIVEKDGKRVKQLEGESRFEIGLDFQAVYVISFEKEGFVTKRLRFDTHVPEERVEFGFEPFGFTIEIFEQYDDVNMVVFNQPVGRISYSELIDEFDYDTDYTKSIQAQVDKAMEDVEVAKEKKAQQVAENAKKIDDLTKKAESSAKSGNIEEAIKNLEEVVALNKDPEVKERIEELKKEAETQKKEKEFEGLMEKAEQAMKDGDLDEAKRLYEQANGVMGGDPKAQKAIADIEVEKKQQAQQAQAFDNALKAAQSALAAGNTDEAIAKAEEALGMKKDPAAEKLLADATKAKEEAEAKAKAQEELQGQVESLMADAQKARDKGNLEEALAKLEEAKQLKADPAIDQEIKAVQQAVAQLEEEKRKQEEAKAEMSGLLDEAESLLAKGDIAGAKAKLTAAGALGKDERIDAIASSIAEQEKRIAEEKEAAAEKQAEIDGLLAKATEQLAAGDLDKAEGSAGEAKALGASDEKVKALLDKVQAKRDEIASKEVAAKEAEAEKKAAMDKQIESAKQALASGDLDAARAALTAAGELGSDPRIADLNKQLADKEKAIAEAEAAKAEAEAKYDQLIADGNSALKEKELTKAEKAFKEAQGIKQDSPEAAKGLAEVEEIRSQLSEIQRKEEADAAAAAAAAEEQEKFEGAISEADKAFEKEDWEKAKTKYNEALAIKDDARAKEQLNLIDQRLDEIAAAEAAQAAEEAEAKKAAAEAAAAEEAGKEAAQEAEAARKAAEEEAAKKAAAEEETARLAAEEAAAKKVAEEAARKEAEEAARLAEQKANESATQEDDAAAQEAARKAAEEEARKQAAEAEAKRKVEIEAALAKGDELLKANRLDQAVASYDKVLGLDPGNSRAKKGKDQVAAIKKKLAEEAQKNKEAAMAITDQAGRESEQLAQIIEEEEIKAAKEPEVKETQAASPTVNEPQAVTFAQPVMEQEERPGAPQGPIIISEDKVGDEARETYTGQLTEEEKFDGMMERTEEQQMEFQASEEMKLLMKKYPDRKTVETETVGNSLVTWVYINNGEFITTYKKVEHNWGGVYYFVDGVATNQRFWEHETE